MSEEYKWTKDPAVSRFLAIFTIGSILLWIASFFIIEDGARILSVPAYMSVCLGCVWLVDKYALREVNLIEEFKKGNINVGLWLLGLFVLVTGIVSIAS